MALVSPQPWTVGWLKSTYLFGVSLTKDDGTPYPDVIFAHAMGYANQWLADTLDIDVQKRTLTERHDLNRSTQGEWFMIRLGRRPVNRIISLKLMIGSTPTPIPIPQSWIMDYDADGGLLWIVPNSQEIQSLTAMQYSLMSARQWTSWGNLPGFIMVEYETGYDVPFEEIIDPRGGWWAPEAGRPVNGKINISILGQTPTGTPAVAPKRSFVVTGTDIATGLTATETLEVPSGSNLWTTKGWTAITSVTWTACEGDILITGNMRDQTNAQTYKPMDRALMDLGGKVASFSILNPAGDLIAGAGIASISQGLGGVSQSVSTTSSATNAGYGARIIQYRKDIEKDLPLVRKRFHGMPLIAV